MKVTYKGIDSEITLTVLSFSVKTNSDGKIAPCAICSRSDGSIEVYNVEQLVMVKEVVKPPISDTVPNEAITQMNTYYTGE